MKKIYILTAFAALVGLIAAFLSGYLLPDRGNDRLILRIGLSAVVLIAAVAFALYKRSQQPPPAEPKPLKTNDELETQLREAESKLSSARLSQGASFSNFLTIFLIGPEGSAKTTNVMQAGIEAELLTGQAIQENAVVPTKFLNIWYARTALVVEAGAKLFATPDSWVRLVRRMMPGGIGTVVGKAGKAGRAALVCIDTESLLKSGDTASVARTLHDRLTRISQTLGISTPVYALFTKADRVPFFREYVQNLTDEEAHQVLGVTLPVAGIDPKRPYAEEQSARLTQSFNRLFYSLCDHRPEFLARENDNLSAASIYEFPREFRKLRSALVPMLVELCRPSQLSIGPFLRGFYFSGVRPVIVQETIAKPAARPVAQQAFQADPGATSMFHLGQNPSVMPARETLGSERSTKKVPQWVFVNKFFQQVLLEDRTALGLSGTSTKTSNLRRILFATVAGLCVLYSIALLVSYSNNRDLEQSAISAANGISSVEGAKGFALASLDSLQKLDFLRRSFERLAIYDRQGPPLGLRWGLYSGAGLYPDVRAIYFEKFRQLLLAPTQAAMLGTLRGLPRAPGEKDEYQPAYDTLRTYLITTSNHEKSTRDYLSPQLLAHWSGAGGVDPQRAQLAGRQFDLYSQELIRQNPFSPDNDKLAVEHARSYLAQFKGTERVYQAMLAQASRENPPVNFNREFPKSDQVLVNRYEVPGAFTKGGWTTMEKAFKDGGRGTSGEPWVVGNTLSADTVEAGGMDTLRARYSQDFIKAWRTYLQTSKLVKYAGLPDAVEKLKSISGPQSPLLVMFALASQNTAVDQDVQNAFRALHSVVPAGTAPEDFAKPTNASYYKALLDLELALEPVASQPPPITEAAADPAVKQAGSADREAREMSQQFGADPEAPTVIKLLEDPITQVQGLLKGPPPGAELNGKGKKLCDQFHLFSTKYPFNPNATAQAALADVNAVFRPKDGALWVFYAESLQKALPKQGAQYVADAASPVHLTPSFVGFFNRAAAFSNALYPAGATDPHLTYSLKPIKTEGIDNSTLVIDGQTLTFSPSSAAAKQFVWPGATHEVKGSVTMGGWADEQGLWAVFRFFNSAERQPQGSPTTVDWYIRGARNVPMTVPGGDRPLTLRYELDMGGNPPVFQKGYLSSLACVAEVAK